MNWEAIGAIAELLGAAGVIVSLLYLATQIRQNTRSVRMTSHHGLMSEFRATARALTQDPELGDLHRKGLENPEQLSEADRGRFGTQVASAVQIYGELYSHHRAGLVEDEFWESRKRNLFYYMALPGVSAWWRGDCRVGGKPADGGSVMGSARTQTPSAREGVLAASLVPAARQVFSRPQQVVGAHGKN